LYKLALVCPSNAGINSVDIDMDGQKVAVDSSLDHDTLLATIKKTGKVFESFLLGVVFSLMCGGFFFPFLPRLAFQVIALTAWCAAGVQLCG
jgi:hypothetical protein